MEKARKIREEKILEGKKEAIRKKAEAVANRPEIAQQRKEMLKNKASSFLNSFKTMASSAASYKPQGMNPNNNSNFGFGGGMSFGNPMAEFTSKQSSDKPSRKLKTFNVKKKVTRYVKVGKNYKKKTVYINSKQKRYVTSKSTSKPQQSNQGFGFGNPMAEFMNKPGKKVSGMGFNPMAEFMSKKNSNKKQNNYKWW
jgi:hypothetical protein